MIRRASAAGSYVPLRRTWVGLLALATCGHAHGLEADLTLHQLNHKSWAIADGAPGAIYAITQTRDGTLWVAGPSGLSRFDGIRFVRYDGTLGRGSHMTDITALAAAPDGSLWMGFGLGGITVLSPSGTVQYDYKDGLSTSAVNNIFMDRGGTVFAATSRGLYRLQDNRWVVIALEDDPNVRVSAAAIDRAGTLWALTDRYLWARRVGEAQFRPIAPRGSTRRVGANSLAAAPDGHMWVLNFNQAGSIARVGPGESAPGTNPPQIVSSDTTANPGMAFDRDGNLWFGGAGVQRLAAPALTGDLTDAAAKIESFTVTDGLTGGTVSAFFEDREGNMWVGTYAGLDRFTRSNVLRVNPTGTFGVAVAGDDGHVWVSAVDAGPGPRYPFLEFHSGAIVSKQDAPHFTAAFRNADGSIWFGGRQGIVRYRSGHPGQTIPLPEADAVQAIAEDSSGAVWVSISRRAFYRYSNGRWDNAQAVSERLPARPLVITRDSQDRLFLGERDNRITLVDGAAIKRFGIRDGLLVGNVTAIAARGADVWIGGDEGLAYFDGTLFQTLVSLTGNPFTGISGIVAPANGDLWLNGNAGIVHLSQAELQRAIRARSYRLRAEVYDRLDGLQGYARQVRPSPSAFEATDGRIWFATQVGLVGIDPARIKHNTLPPPVTIWSIDGRSVQFPSVELAMLPVHTTNIRIEYTAASLAVPERVHFRYRLDGLDPDWQDVGDRREAIYTNLAPGRYAFHVIASNNDGVWNNAGASLSFNIAPAFYQTRWFYGLCALLFLAFLWLVYVVRIRQVAAQVRARLEERLAERERIARELHDTLLQSVQGLVLRFRAAVSRLPPQEPARSVLEQALDRADGVLVEGRDRVKDLRSSKGGDLALPQAIALLGEELAAEDPIDFRSTVEGIPRDLHPIVAEEVLSIAREALINAFRHATAQRIEADITYGDAELQIRIRDDGRGIDAEVLRAGGREGHWGLLGMRERARKIRAALTVWSKPGAGTEVDLRLPAHIAYRVPKRVSPLGNLVSWRS